MKSGATVAYFQADSTIGLGHSVRLRALIDSLALKHELILTADGEFALRGFESAKVYPRSEILNVLRTVSGPAILLVDHPSVPRELWMSERADILVVALDDTGSADLRADILINCSGFDAYHNYPSMKEGIRLLGLKYLPLRPEFSHANSHGTFGEANRFRLGFMAGSSPAASNWIRAVLEMKLDVCDSRDVHIVVSPSTAGFDSLAERGAQRGFRISRGLSVSELIEFLESCKVCVMTAGMSLYEAFATRTPVIAYPIQPDMQPECAQYAEEGMIVSVDAMDEPVLTDAISRLWNSEEARREMAMRAARNVDGRGLSRAAEVIRFVFTKMQAGTPKSTAIEQWKEAENESK